MPASKSLYVPMAATIKRHYEDKGYGGIEVEFERRLAIRNLALDLATDLKDNNMNFDRQKFLIACGISS